jgi:hypothetical protein
LLVWNCLHPSIGGDNNVAHGQVLLKLEPVGKAARARDGANPPPSRSK